MEMSRMNQLATCSGRKRSGEREKSRLSTKDSTIPSAKHSVSGSTSVDALHPAVSVSAKREDAHTTMYFRTLIQRTLRRKNVA